MKYEYDKALGRNRQPEDRQEAASGMKQEFNREAWAEQKKAEREEVGALIQQACKRMQMGDAKFITRYYDTQAVFDRMGVSNTLLLALQGKESVTEIRTLEEWNANQTRVNKGEKALKILEAKPYQKTDGTRGTSYQVKKVFDISQTTQKRFELPLNLDPRYLSKTMLDTLSLPFELSGSLDDRQASFYDAKDKVIYVRAGSGDSVGLFRSLAYEVALAEIDQKVEGYNRQEAAYPAACAAYMLCRRNHVDPGDFYDITHMPEAWHTCEEKELKAQLGLAKEVFHAVSSRMEQEINRRKDRAVGQER